MITPMGYDKEVYVIEESTNAVRCRTDFVCDDGNDITAANAEGSEYLKYPAGSTIYEPALPKLYVLDASRTAYK